MLDFLRMQTFPLLSGLITLMVLIVLSYYFVQGAKVHLSGQEIKTTKLVRNWVFILFFVGWGYWLFSVGVLNHVPKNTVDHSVVNSRSENLEKDAQKRLEETTPE